MHLHRLLILVGLMAMVCVASAAASTPMEVHSGMPETSIQPYLYLYDDETNSLNLGRTAAQLKEQDITDLGFQPLLETPFDRAGGAGTRWLHFALHNSSEDMAYDLLVLYSVHFQTLNLFVVNAEGEIGEVRGGNKVPVEERFLDARFTIYPVEIRPGRTVNYFLSVATDQKLSIPMVVSGYRDFFEKDLFVQSINWLLFGIGLGLLIYNLCLAFFAREIVFLLNGLVMFTGMVILGWGDANLFQIWDSPWLHSIYFVVCAVFAATLIQQQFLRYYLETPDHHPVLDGLLKVCLLVTLLGLVAIPFIAVKQLFLLAITFYFGIQLVDFALLLYISASGSKAARIYMVALLLAAVLWMCGLFLPESGGFNRLLLLHLFSKLGLVTQIIVLTLGMGLRIYRIRQRVEDSNRRFQVVSQENAGLSKQNIQLQKASHTDGLTQVGNRAHFESTLNREWSRALREQSTLTLLLVDVDHFKRVNDTHGHLFGDQCLVAIALAIRGCLHRGSDSVMRYGGEEFVALLAGTDVGGVPIVGERIRLAVKSLEFDDFTLTVSVGGASIVPKAGQKSSDFVELVDKALYAAKDQGRDCVVVRSSSLSEISASHKKFA